MEKNLEEAAFHTFVSMEWEPVSWISSKDEIGRRTNFKKLANT